PDRLMGQRETIAAFHRRILLRIEALVDHDPGLIEENCAEDIGVTLGIARNAKQFVGVVELHAKLEMLLDDVLNRDRRFHLHTTGVRELCQQGLGVTLDGVIRYIGYAKGHLSQSSYA